MFDKEFYPTPKNIIDKMIEPFKGDLGKLFILEPSAGKGDILDYLTSKIPYTYVSKAAFCKCREIEIEVSAKKNRLYCLEKDPNLSFILQGKGYKLLGNDFLEYRPQYKIDLIVMNPPFSNGDEHLLHAWDILDGGDIVCLLNAETIKNPYTRTRDLLSKIIADHGSVEFLGDCFSDAERRTGVDVALVRLKKPKTDKFDFKFNPNEKESNINFMDDVSEGNQLAINDKVGAYMRVYDNVKSSFADYLKAKSKLQFYVNTFLEKDKLSSLLKSCEADGSGDLSATYNFFIDEVKSAAWSIIIDEAGLNRYMTKSVKDKLIELKTAQGANDLTRDNIRQFITMILGSAKDIQKQAVVDVFDIFTKFYKENRCYEEGWKTNSAWRVNRKVILPLFVEPGHRGYYVTNSSMRQEYDDIERVMCYLSGKSWENMDAIDPDTNQVKMVSLRKAICKVKVGDSGMYESEFFKFRCYQKGTIHITFKDELLWNRFNLEACDGKFNLGY